MAVRIFGIANSTNPAEDYRLTDVALMTSTSAMNARTGVTTAPTLTGTGAFTCNLSPFSCVIDGTSGAMQGAYRAVLDAAEPFTINAADTQARIDLIGLQIQDDAYDGSGAHDGLPVYVAGTPGSGAAPAIPANCIPLFTIPVAANAASIDFGAATAVFQFTAAAGGIIPVRNANDKPAASGVVAYRHRLDVTATATGPSPLESSTDGTTWTPVSAGADAFGTWTNLTLTSSFVSAITPQWRTAPGGRIEFRGIADSATTVNPGVTMWTGGPTPASTRRMAAAPVAGGKVIGIEVLANGTGVFSANSTAGTYNGGLEFSLDGCWCSA